MTCQNTVHTIPGLGINSSVSVKKKKKKKSGLQPKHLKRMRAFILPCVIDVTSGCLLHATFQSHLNVIDILQCHYTFMICVMFRSLMSKSSGKVLPIFLTMEHQLYKFKCSNCLFENAIIVDSLYLTSTDKWKHHYRNKLIVRLYLSNGQRSH